jgi:putative addiction module killer protein
MKTIVETDVFKNWIKKLRNATAQAIILERIRRVSLGLFGDVKPVGEGVSELRINYGPGYRVYFKQIGDKIVVLLCGGNKSTQQKNIETAKKLAAHLEV